MRELKMEELTIRQKLGMVMVGHIFEGRRECVKVQGMILICG